MRQYLIAVAVVTLTSAADAKSTPVPIGTTVPGFGCLGWSPPRGVAACVVGARGWNIGETTISVVFVPIRDKAETLEPIKLRHAVDERGPDELTDDERSRLANRLEGFVTFDRSSAVLQARLPGTTAPVSVGGVTLSAEVTAIGKMIAAQRFRVSMTYTRGSTKRALDDQRDSISAYTAQVRVVEGTTLVERTYATGDEGIYGSYGAVWRCSKTSCDEPLGD